MFANSDELVLPPCSTSLTSKDHAGLDRFCELNSCKNDGLHTEDDNEAAKEKLINKRMTKLTAFFEACKPAELPNLETLHQDHELKKTD